MFHNDMFEKEAEEQRYKAAECKRREEAIMRDAGVRERQAHYEAREEDKMAARGKLQQDIKQGWAKHEQEYQRKENVKVDRLRDMRKNREEAQKQKPLEIDLIGHRGRPREGVAEHVNANRGDAMNALFHDAPLPQRVLKEDMKALRGKKVGLQVGHARTPAHAWS